MTAYYNENDKFAAAWLRELIKAKLIAEGEVDERSIEEVQAADLSGYTQCHFFAGIGGWSYALRLAGWPDDRPVWTGSCPCQPFSAAGHRKAGADERHLWPSWVRLIRKCRPDTIFGEQVAGAAGLGWLDLVCTDLEADHYTVGACVLGAHSVGAPHLRQRLWFVADSRFGTRERNARSVPGTQAQSGGERELNGDLLERHSDGRATRQLADTAQRDRWAGECRAEAGTRQDGKRWGRLASGGADGMGHAKQPGLEGYSWDEPDRAEPGRQRSSTARYVAPPSHSGELADADGGHTSPEGLQRSGEQRQQPENGCVSCLWSHCDWLHCRDGKARPVEPGTFPLAHGIPARVGRLRGYGNAIVPQAAAAFIKAYRESLA